jgi:hypothetical protein
LHSIESSLVGPCSYKQIEEITGGYKGVEDNKTEREYKEEGGGKHPKPTEAPGRPASQSTTTMTWQGELRAATKDLQNQDHAQSKGVG